MLMTYWELKELEKLVDHCGRQYEKHLNGDITISMKAYIRKLEKVCQTRERMKQWDDGHSATESHEFRGING